MSKRISIHRQLLPPKFPKPFIESFLPFAAGGICIEKCTAAEILAPCPAPKRGYIFGCLYSYVRSIEKKCYRDSEEKAFFVKRLRKIRKSRCEHTG